MKPGGKEIRGPKKSKPVKCQTGGLPGTMVLIVNVYTFRLNYDTHVPEEWKQFTYASASSIGLLLFGLLKEKKTDLVSSHAAQFEDTFSFRLQSYTLLCLISQKTPSHNSNHHPAASKQQCNPGLQPHHCQLVRQ